MYGDTDVMRRRATQLREQGIDLRSMADHLVAQTEGIGWTGRAAESMSERIRARATHLREVAAAHDGAADSLDRHLQQVEHLKDTIATREHKASSIVTDAATRVARVDAHDDLDGVRREADPGDRELASFTPPPSGHRDWLTVEIVGL